MVLMVRLTLVRRSESISTSMPFDQLFHPAGSSNSICIMNVVVLVSVYVGAGVLVGEGAVTVKVAVIAPGFMPTSAAVKATVGNSRRISFHLQELCSNGRW